MFTLLVEFCPLLSNGDVDWNAPIKFWERRFDCRARAMCKFMRMVCHFTKHTNNTTKHFCNLRGTLLDNETVIHSWDWTDLEIRDEWSRSEACSRWLDELASIQSFKIIMHIVESSPRLVDILCFLGLCESRNDARRQIEGNGIKINGQKVSDVNRCLGLNDFVNSEVLLSRGKKHKHKLVLVDG